MTVKCKLVGADRESIRKRGKASLPGLSRHSSEKGPNWKQDKDTGLIMPGTGQIVRPDVIAGLKYWSLYLIFFFSFQRLRH